MFHSNIYMSGRPVYIVDGNRTPFLKARGKPGPFSAADLAVAAGRSLLLRHPFAPTELDQVVLGCVIPGPEEANIARVVALRLGCGKGVPAWTVQRNCGSGMQAVDAAAADIASGRCDLALAGGTEAMSRAPLILNREMTAMAGEWAAAGSLAQKLRLLGRLRRRHLTPVNALLEGLTDPVCGLSMGQTAEELAWRFRISRERMDAYALESHHRLASAQDGGRLRELDAVYDVDGNYYDHDQGVRRESDMAALGRLKPAFEHPFGLVTAGNSAQITDGAAWVILASGEAVDKYGLAPMARIADCQWAGVAPEVMGLGPVHAMSPIMARHTLQTEDIGVWEINEAFAAQVLACLEAWRDAEYCRKELGLDRPFAPIPRERLNMDGGAVAIGHPVGTSGARIVLHLAHLLVHTGSRLGMASLCIGGGQGGAMLLEQVEARHDR